MDFLNSGFVLASFGNCLEGDNNFNVGFIGYLVVVFVSFVGYCCLEGSFLVEIFDFED
ncbi:hypothetical protein [uncultured Methanobrevibacter sp.]|uniref:hypothetical protein n=1 Tax=uncultured Methanobrevibacter sp. TaxID=253161 RepID=UPI0025F53253|nr:hypothetical protein [uncultured Methanobrevibacter sp.]